MTDGLLSNLEFFWHWALWLLPLPWLLSLLRKHINKNLSTHHKYLPVSPRLGYAMQQLKPSRSHKHRLNGILLGLTWIGLIVALSQPSVPDSRQASAASGRALVLAVDLSGSMEREDFELDGLQANRLAVVKEVASKFLQKRQGDRVALVLYGKEAFLASPLTFDLNSLDQILASSGIGMAGRSTAIGDALGLSIQSLQNDPAPRKVIVLLSDGTNNAGSVEPESAAQLAAQLGIQVHTIAMGSVEAASLDTDSDRSINRGFGTQPSADLDEETLQSIAETSGGGFFRATTTASLEEVYTAIDKIEGAETRPPPLVVKHDLRNYPLLLALLSCLLLVAINLRRTAATVSFAKSQQQRLSE